MADSTSLIDERQPPLKRKDLADSPIPQFERWWQAATERRVPDREAMHLATVDADGTVSSRMVLLRGYSPAGFVFFGNYDSRKARAIAAHAHVGLTFFWPTVYQQIRIEGKAAKISAAESEAYFRSRPRDSQLGAWASRQSSILSSRDVLTARFRELEAEYSGRDVPYPTFWGGWRVAPGAVEFWQGQLHRLHDRFRYERQGDGWNIVRLAP